jgi:hypothetical protein
MKSKDFKKLLKEEDPKHILFRYTHGCYSQVKGVYLTDKQLQQVIDLKNKKSREEYEQRTANIYNV